MMNEMMICNRCNKVKVLEEFSRKKNGEYQKTCNACKDKQKEYYLKNKEHINELSRKRSKRWLETHTEYMKQYRENNKEDIKEKRKRYLEDHADIYTNYWKKYYQENKEKIKQKYRQLKEMNKKGE